MALSAGPRFGPVSETRKKGGDEEKEVRVSFPGHSGLLEVQEEPLINYDHYRHHLCQGY